MWNVYKITKYKYTYTGIKERNYCKQYETIETV